MKATIVVVYAVMAVWLVLAAIGRLVIQLTNAQALDPLPYITGGLGLLCLVLLVPGYRRLRAQRRD